MDVSRRIELLCGAVAMVCVGATSLAEEVEVFGIWDSDRYLPELESLLPPRVREVEFDLDLTSDCPKVFREFAEERGLLGETGDSIPTRPRGSDGWCFLTGRAECFDEKELAACQIEIVDRAIDRTNRILSEMPDRYSSVTELYNDYLPLKEIAEKTQCDADFSVANNKGNIAFYRLRVGPGFADDLELIVDGNRIDEIETLHETSAVTVKALVSDLSGSDPVSFGIIVNGHENLLPPEIEWRMSGVHRSSILSIDQTLPTSPPKPERRVAALQTANYDVRNWTVKGGGIGAVNVKDYSGTYRPPDGFKYCSHQLSVYSAIRVCDNWASTGYEGVKVGAKVRSKPTSRARGWFNFTVSVKGISKDATSCQREKMGCLPYASFQPIPSDASLASCELAEYVNRPQPALCRTSCVKGVKLCYGGEIVPGGCREFPFPEICGSCVGGDF